MTYKRKIDNKLYFCSFQAAITTSSKVQSLPASHKPNVVVTDGYKNKTRKRLFLFRFRFITLILFSVHRWLDNSQHQQPQTTAHFDALRHRLQLVTIDRFDMLIYIIHRHRFVAVTVPLNEAGLFFCFLVCCCTKIKF